VTNPHLVTYDFEQLPMRAGLPSTFMIHELTEKNKGMTKVTSLYLLEEVASRSGTLRVSFFTQVGSEDEARTKIKNIASLQTTISMLDRWGDPVGSLAQIQDKAKNVAKNYDIEVVSEEDDSQADDAIESVKGEIEQTEHALEIEEADNTPVPLVAATPGKPTP